MQIIKNSELDTLFKGATEGFWSQLFDELVGESYRRLDDFQKKNLPVDSRLDDDKLIGFPQKLAGDTLMAVKSEMSSNESMYQSEPSRYHHKFALAFLRHTARLKRELVVTNHELRGYDMEKDIRETEAVGHMNIESSLQNEIAYWKAMEAKNYGDAKIILSTIELLRTEAELTLRVEVLNWKLELYTLLGDTEMFVDTINKSFSLGVYMNGDSLKCLVERLLISRGFNRIMVGINREGELNAQRHPQGRNGFVLEHVTVFSRSLVTQVAEELIKHPVQNVAEFDAMLQKAIDKCRDSLLAVCPHITLLRVLTT